VTTKLDELLPKVREAMEGAQLVAWDGCHKIYLAMDPIEGAWFLENYEYTFQGTAQAMYETVVDWYESSCSLRFVSAVRHNADDPNEGFTHLISQFEDYEDEEE
jgi:hypothetical protein